MIKIHAIETGKVRVKQFQVAGAKSTISRLWQLFFTNKWSDWLPVYCWLIEHPEGPFLIDTGEIAKVAEPGFLPDSAAFKGSAQYNVKRDDEVDEGLKKLGYKPEQIKTVLLTHLHSDHADGLYHFPHAKIMVSKEAYEIALSPKGAGIGYLKDHFPENFNPEVFDFDKQEEVFGASYTITSDGSITAVPLPGHAPGHTAYIINTGNSCFILSGDATFDKTTMEEKVPFVILNSKEAKVSVEKIKAFVSAGDVTMLGSHDPKVKTLLEK